MMARNNADDILNMISALQRLEIGDLDRLVRIRNRLLDNDIRQDDVSYVYDMFDQIHSMTRRKESLPDAGTSRIWYLLPVFLSIVGGVIAYLALRHKDARRARRTLLLGSVLFAIFAAILVAGAISDKSDTASDTADGSIDTDAIQTDSSSAEPAVTVLDENVADAAANQLKGESEPAFGSNQPRSNATHRISYDKIPDYADPAPVLSALEQALQAWDSSNSFLDFELVESDANLHVKWARWMPAGGLGRYTEFGAESADTNRHIITIRLGNEDCHSNYQAYNTESLKHTIAHEIGHYLGLRHIDYKDHLMYSAELFDVDAASTYDYQGYTIPTIKRPTHNTQYGSDMLSQIESAQSKLRDIVDEREELKSMQADPDLLYSNTERHNELVRMLESLDEELECAELAGSLLARLK